MAKLKVDSADTLARRVAAILLSSDLSEAEILDLSRKLTRASPFPKELAKWLRVERPSGKEVRSNAAAELVSVGGAEAAIASLKLATQEAKLTVVQIAEMLGRIAAGTGWVPNQRYGRERMLSSFLKSTGVRGYREALRQLGAEGAPDPFLEGITKRGLER